MLEPNPYSDGKIRGKGDAIVRAIVIAVVIFIAWISPFVRYWRIVIFFCGMFIIGIIYPTIQLFLVNKVRKEGPLDTHSIDLSHEDVLESLPDLKKYNDETRAWRERMMAMTKKAAEAEKAEKG